MTQDNYVPALRFRWLTALYDPLIERWMAASQLRQVVVEALDLRPVWSARSIRLQPAARTRLTI